jgi:histidinol dehydrogenase
MTNELKITRWATLDQPEQVAAQTRPPLTAKHKLSASVTAIISAVRARGDAAVAEYTEKFDGITLAVNDLRVSETEITEASARVSPEARAAMQVAIDNISRFHAAQISAPVRVETMPGVICERVTRPIRAVGLYVPAGSAPLPSTAMMLAIPAGIAKCPVKVICTPPRPDGRADPAVIVAATLCGIDTIFKVGGAQAIAAMAYGTETIPKVDKVFGPGNAWVTEAKTTVAGDPAGAALDMPAGPSEVLVIADGTTDPRFVAMDLLSQAEHGPDSQVILICTDDAFATRVNEAIIAALPGLPRREIIEQSLEHGIAIVVGDLAEAIRISNLYAPEHLIIQVSNPRQYIDYIDNAGSIFLGPWTPEAVGDYCSGTNHVLPTYGFARNYSGLSVTDFEKQLTVQELTRAGLTSLAPTVLTLAGLEGLDAHAQAVAVRVEAEATADGR